MKESMGQIIRKLRKERNLTQEELAEQLNITYQAVSRWENETGMPDISQVIPLANVFGVSVDVLFGTQNIDRDAEVQRIIEEASAPLRLNYENEEEEFEAFKKEYETYIEALKTYPNSIPLLYSSLLSGYVLASEYSDRKDHQKATSLRRECIRQGNVILNTCKDVTRLMNTHKQLVDIYVSLGDFESAEKHAEKLPKEFINSGSTVAYIKSNKGDTEGAIAEHSCNISQILNLFEDEALCIGNEYFYKGQYEDAIRCYKSLYDMISVIYDNEEYTPPYHILTVGDHIARCYIKLGLYDEAVEWLWKDYEHICKNAKYYNKKEHVETPLLRGHTFQYFGESMDVKGHMKYLEYPVYDVLREHPRYIELLEKIKGSDKVR